MQTKPSVIILRPVSIIKILISIAIFLVLANIFFGILKYITDERFFDVLFRLFQLNDVNSIPTFFSGCLFLGNAVLLILIWKLMWRNGKHHLIWILLAGLFLFLAFDELFKIHGLLIGPIRRTLRTFGLPRYIIGIFFVLGLLTLSYLFFPAWRRLNKKVKLWIALSAATFLSGAIVIDIIGSIYFRMLGWRKNLLYRVLDTFEESLELAGLIMFIYALQLLLQKEFNGVSIVISDKKD